MNFAICEYYNDSIFTQLSQLIFTTLGTQDYTELASYEKVHKNGFVVTLHFFNSHLELLFSKFDASLIEVILNLLIRGMKEGKFEVQSDCCTCINQFNEFVLEMLRNKSVKKQELV